MSEISTEFDENMKQIANMPFSFQSDTHEGATRGRQNDLPTVTKAELSELLFAQVGLNKREAKEMVEMFFEEISHTLEQGEAVRLSGFGNFQLRDKPQRPGRNPRTGEEIPIKARRVVTFHASQKLKAMVEDAHKPDSSGIRTSSHE